MQNSSTIISWMNDDELGPLLSRHALITCVMVTNSWAGMAIKGCTGVIQRLCSASKPVAVVYTEEERDDFLREAIKEVKARDSQGAPGEPGKAPGEKPGEKPDEKPDEQPDEKPDEKPCEPKQ